MLMAKVVSDLANRTAGKEAVAMESFAKALRMVSVTSGQHLPTILSYAFNTSKSSGFIVAL